MGDRFVETTLLDLESAVGELDSTAVEIVERDRCGLEFVECVGEQLACDVDVTVSPATSEHLCRRREDLGKETRGVGSTRRESRRRQLHGFVVLAAFGAQRRHVRHDEGVDVASVVGLVGREGRFVVDDGTIGVTQFVMNRGDRVQDVSFVDPMIGRAIERQGAQALRQGFGVIARIGVDQTDEVQAPGAYEWQPVGVGELVGFSGECESVTRITVVMSERSQAIETLPLDIEVAITSSETSSVLDHSARSTRIRRLDGPCSFEQTRRVVDRRSCALLVVHTGFIGRSGGRLENEARISSLRAVRATTMPRVRTRQRRVDRAAVAGLVPLVAVLPIFLLAMTPFWWLISRFVTIGYLPSVAVYVVAGGLLFVPVVQRRVLTRLIGARRPTRDEALRLQRAFDEVTQALHIRDHRFAVGVIDDDDLNAFACGGHLVVVTSFAARELDHDALCGVLAHEFCHHLGSHTVALTLQQWLLVPVDALARIGSFLDNVAVAAASTFGRRSRPVEVTGRLVAPIFRALARFFGLGRVVSTVASNLVGRAAEYSADRRVVTMGYGRQLSSALRRTIPAERATAERRWSRLFESHPPARTRVARLEATMRRGR